MFDYIAGYGLGGSSVALFCRVGGGIYTKAADVGADLVGKNELGLKEDSPDNPATIADNVGDNVGDIAGMGSDLFGSFAEASCAALVVSGTSTQLIAGGNFLAPLVVAALGIIACLFTIFFATHVMTVTTEDKIEETLKWQLLISSLILTPIIVLCYLYLLPPTFTFSSHNPAVRATTYHNWGIVICGLCGLWSGMIIGWFTDYFTSKSHGPTIGLAVACKSGAAINIIHGLALGYLSCIIPILCIAITIFFSFTYGGMYGISIAALGMLSNLSICLAIDGYGPISDNAGGISEMSELPEAIRDLTDALDAAGNTTAAIGKGFAIGSACLVALALFGAFVTRTKISGVNLLEEIQIASIIIGAMIPYVFSALTMKSVGLAAAEMCKQVCDQVRAGKNDPKECIRIATESSLREMILPGLMVIFTPLLLGTLFGPKSVTGYLAGVIISGVQMAISSSNTGGAWDNAKKYIEAGMLKVEATDHIKGDKVVNSETIYYPKRSRPHKAAVVGDTVGDPLKDTSGPSINILIKLSSIVALVFGDYIVYTNWAQF
jgi:inorganic pyrophosphatase